MGVKCYLGVLHGISSKTEKAKRRGRRARQKWLIWRRKRNEISLGNHEFW